jgi:hypothetical protein
VLPLACLLRQIVAERYDAGHNQENDPAQQKNPTRTDQVGANDVHGIPHSVAAGELSPATFQFDFAGQAFVLIQNLTDGV